MKNNFRSIIISLSVVIAAWILGSAWKSSHSSNHTISVTGLASKDFDSDLIVWSGSVIRKSLELKDAYAEIKKDQETIKKYLIAKGILESEMVFNSINISKDFNVIYNNDGSRRETFNGFVLSQQVEINSKNVEKVEKISREVTEIIDQGIEFNSNVPSYYYTKLDKLKLEMLANATANAKQMLAQNWENLKKQIWEFFKLLLKTLLKNLLGVEPLILIPRIKLQE